MLTRTEVEEWIVDVRAGCVPDGEVFVEIATRMLEAERKLGQINADHLVNLERLRIHAILQEAAR